MSTEIANPVESSDAVRTLPAIAPDGPIGVFDSGVGGLTVLKALRQRLPRERFVYLGDTARVPYGNKAPDTVARYALGCARFLLQHRIKALVVACNTASAFALDAIVAALRVPVIGVIDPAARKAVGKSSSGTLGVIGTRGTIASNAYKRIIKAHAPDTQVLQVPCPLFVPLVEEGMTDGEVARLVARDYLRAFEGSNLDTLILGCTHYPLLRPVIQETLDELLGRSIHVIDSADATAQELSNVLAGRGALSGAPPVAPRYFVTDDPKRFAQFGPSFVGEVIGGVEHIDLVT